MRKSVHIPVPPSTNARLTKGFHLTADYRVWRRQIVPVLNASRPRTPYRNCAVYILANINYTRDLDNIEKGILDMLQYCNWLVDDRYVDHKEATRCKVDAAGQEIPLHWCAVSVCERARTE